MSSVHKPIFALPTNTPNVYGLRLLVCDAACQQKLSKACMSSLVTTPSHSGGTPGVRQRQQSNQRPNAVPGNLYDISSASGRYALSGETLPGDWRGVIEWHVPLQQSYHRIDHEETTGCLVCMDPCNVSALGKTQYAI